MTTQSIRPAVLRPYNASESLTIKQAAAMARRTPATIRSWAANHDIGRRVGPGRWEISKVCLSMFLDGDYAALRAYLRGSRGCTLVGPYFERAGLAGLLKEESEPMQSSPFKPIRPGS